MDDHIETFHVLLLSWIAGYNQVCYEENENGSQPALVVPIH